MTTPKRGGEHPSLGYYMGGCALDDDYKLVKQRPFGQVTQLRSAKQLGINQSSLLSAKLDSSVMKFNGKLETLCTDITKLDKDQFITAVKEKVRYYGLHNFFYLRGPDGKMCYLLDNSHAFTVKEVITEHESRLVEPTAILDDTGAETMASVAA